MSLLSYLGDRLSQLTSHSVLVYLDTIISVGWGEGGEKAFKNALDHVVVAAHAKFIEKMLQASSSICSFLFEECRRRRRGLSVK